jgi:hypothetical protein
MDTSQDSRCRRCPRLGHEITFEYCRRQDGGTVCPRILDCWWETFDVRGYLREHLSEEEFAALSERPPPKEKVLSLVELIEQAKKRAARSEGESS